MAGVEGRHGAGRRHTWPEAQKKCLLLAVSSPVGCCTERRAASAVDDKRPSRGGGRSMIARSRRSLARASSVEHRAVRAVQAPCGVWNAAARWPSALRTCVFLCGLGPRHGRWYSVPPSLHVKPAKKQEEEPILQQPHPTSDGSKVL